MSENFAAFLNRISGEDCEFLGYDELHKIPETICALANSSGGWIIAGAFHDETGGLILSGLDDSIRPRMLFAGCECEVFDDPARIIAAHVKALSHNEKPVILDGKVYRRIEGVNVISGKFARTVLASEAIESSRDDFPVENMPLDRKSLSEFKHSVTKLAGFTGQEFLRRSFIYSGKHLTFAGALMFSNILQIRAELHYSGKIFALKAPNIWRACHKIIPRLTCRLSTSCAGAVRAALLNALLHADYNIDNHVNISVIADPPRIIISNPGTIRGSVRNKRLCKIFELAGLSRGLHDDLRVIKTYRPNFRLSEDLADFRVIAELELEGVNKLPAPVLL